MIEDGWPLLTTLHHPITVDRELALAHADQRLAARSPPRRWFGFLRHAGAGGPAAARAIVTVSESSQPRHRRPDGRARPTG